MGSVRITGAGPAPLDGIGLAIAPEAMGDALALHFSEDSASRASWSFRVFVHTDEGVYPLGEVRTRPPAAGVPAARTVALAFCPGARGWTVVPTGPAGATGVLVLSTSQQCAGGIALAPLVGVNGSQVSARTWPAPVLGAVAGIITADPGGLLVLPGTLTKVFGFLDTAAPIPGGGLYFQLHDKAAAVAPGDVPRLAPVPLAVAGQAFSLALDPAGVEFVNGIRWVISSAPAVFAVVAAGDIAYVQGEVL